MTVRTERGWNEAIIVDDCNYDKYYLAVDILKRDFGVRFYDEDDWVDTLHWNFRLDGNWLTLYYNIYKGLIIFPTRLDKGTKEENVMAVELGKKLHNLLAS